MNEQLIGDLFAEATRRMTGSSSKEFSEKFAELIVRECMEWCDAHATINGTAQQIRDSIKKDFGVEE